MAKGPLVLKIKGIDETLAKLKHKSKDLVHLADSEMAASFTQMATTAKSYIEFGTGRYFPNYPGKEKEWQDLARQYYKNGKGWMRPSPYFYPTVKSYFIILVNNLQRIFKKDERL